MKAQHAFKHAAPQTYVAEHVKKEARMEPIGVPTANTSLGPRVPYHAKIITFVNTAFLHVLANFVVHMRMRVTDAPAYEVCAAPPSKDTGHRRD